MPYTKDSQSITIQSGQAESSAINCTNGSLAGLIFPATMTNSSLALRASLDNVTYYDVYDSTGVPVKISVQAGKLIAFNPADFCGLPYMKLLGASNEGALRTIQALLREV